ncbi:cryptochrome/photolyase family protein [Sungkyunkwania multivorans]|uniref:Cryptochrome/photolyase family protein n=1 Tax=Sungkyunkwania multivorans TaxID=1173618 RepID=A0ABW3CY33_9FLAO
MKTLRLILGDQLNSKHSWFKKSDEDVLYVMMEMRQETDYVTHHIQKVVAFFLAMREFSSWLKDEGHEVKYYYINDDDNTQSLAENLQKLIAEHTIEKFEYLLPDEYRLDEQLRDFCEELSIETEVVDTEHFLTTREDLQKFYEGKKQMVMEYFYRDMRKKYDLLMDKDEPEGGKWNFDHSNRNKWKGEHKIPAHYESKKDVSEIVSDIEKAGIKTIGKIDADHFEFPTNRKECLEQLKYFCEELLVHFGDYQDAMHTEQVNLFHSRLSFAMNSKLISPLDVVKTVISYYRKHEEDIHISQVEGFVRQIIGWREYMRGIYWKEMPEYAKKNELENHQPLPDFYWSGKTKMSCLKHAINNSLDNAYAHHIQRLMVTGNFALLADVHPDEVDQWYLGIYIDAIEWVEMPNTRGMSQFADGGIVATKPYVSSGSYINKMSNYCSDCHYNVKKKTGDDACPFNSLYWNFIDSKRAHFENNNRMAMMLSMLDKKPSEELSALKERAADIIQNPDNY